jgi:hypothetical protein
MNTTRKLTTPPWLALILGIPALALIAILHLTGQDDRRLFLPGHFAGILVWVLVFTMLVLTGIVTYLANMIIQGIGIENYFEILKGTFKGFGELLKDARKEGALGWVILYATEAVCMMFFTSLFSVLFLGCCIAFGSVVAKKAKVLASIGIYFGANWLFSVVVMIFLVFGIMAFGSWVAGANLTDTQIAQLVGLLMFGVVALQAMLCSLLYTLQYRLLDRKLNLP